MDSDYYGPSGVQDTSLVSPVVDMSSLTAPVVGFKQDYNNLGDIADVDVSVDGGATWETVLHQTSSVCGPREDVVQLPMAAGEPDVQVRFHNHEADYDWWWMVDDVETALLRYDAYAMSRALDDNAAVCRALAERAGDDPLRRAWLLDDCDAAGASQLAADAAARTARLLRADPPALAALPTRL